MNLPFVLVPNTLLHPQRAPLANSLTDKIPHTLLHQDCKPRYRSDSSTLNPLRCPSTNEARPKHMGKEGYSLAAAFLVCVDVCGP